MSTLILITNLRVFIKLTKFKKKIKTLYRLIILTILHKIWVMETKKR